MPSGKDYTLAELEPGWTEETHEHRAKTSMRMHGSLRMVLRRVGRNPENSRRYVPGDPVNLIDWKAYARTDELLIREQRDEASSQVYIVVDAGASMQWPDPDWNEGPQVAVKFEIALRSALWLAHTHLVMGDTVSCWLRRSENLPDVRWVPRSPADVMALFAVLSRDKKTSFNSVVKDFFIAHPWPDRPSDTMWLLTDGLESWSISRLAMTTKRLMFAHVLSSCECVSQWMDDETCYVERSPQRKDYMGAQLKTGGAFEQAVEDWRKTWQQQLKTWGGSYFLATDTTSVGAFFHWVTAMDER